MTTDSKYKHIQLKAYRNIHKGFAKYPIADFGLKSRGYDLIKSWDVAHKLSI